MAIYFFFILHFVPFLLFSCYTFSILHHFHVALFCVVIFSCCTFFRVEIFLCIALFHVALLHVAMFSFCILLLFLFLYSSLFVCCNFFLLHFLHGALITEVCVCVCLRANHLVLLGYITTTSPGWVASHSKDPWWYPSTCFLMVIKAGHSQSQWWRSCFSRWQFGQIGSCGEESNRWRYCFREGWCPDLRRGRRTSSFLLFIFFVLREPFDVGIQQQPVRVLVERHELYR